MRAALTKGLVGTVALALVALGTASQAQAADPGVTKNGILIGMTAPQTGPAAPGYKDISAGANAYFAHLNANGGVNGRLVTLRVADDKYSPTLTVTETDNLIGGADPVFAMLGALGTANHLAVVDRLTAAGVPDVFPNTGSSAFDNPKKYPGTFPYFPSYVVEAKVMAHYITQDATLTGLKRCFMYQEGEFGENAGLGFKAAGMTFAAEASYVSGSQVNPFAAQVTKLKAAGCQLVVFFGVTSATANLLLTSAGLGFKPTWMVTSVGSEPVILKGLAAAKNVNGNALLTGMYTPSFLQPITDVGNPYVSGLKAIVEKAGLPWNFYTYYGANTAYVFSQALKAAGPNLTRKGLIAAVQSQGSKFTSAASVPMLYTANSHQGLLGYWMGQYDSAGSLGRITPYVMIAGNNTSSGTVKQIVFKPAGPSTKNLLP